VSASPFHYAFLVRDIAESRQFYCDLLGCTEGRSTDTWMDFDFFGNQLSAHLGQQADSGQTGTVDGVQVPMPHFGALVSWEEFPALAERLRVGGARFVIEPRLRYQGKPGEQMTMFFLDPSGNPIEIKAFRDPSEVFSV
jgi:extradiol dioxygenase family protein